MVLLWVAPACDPPMPISNPYFHSMNSGLYHRPTRMSSQLLLAYESPKRKRINIRHTDIELSYYLCSYFARFRRGLSISFSAAFGRMFQVYTDSLGG